MRCAAPKGQKVAVCVGLIVPSGEPFPYQCPFCARVGRTIRSDASDLAKRIGDDREKIKEFMQKPTPTAANLLYPNTDSKIRSEKERKGWEKYITYMTNRNSSLLIGTYAQKQWSKMVEVVLVELFKERLDTGITPTLFALVVSGSVARREACPYSDVESFILIDKKINPDYFKEVAEHVNLIMHFSGEGTRGFGFDDELCPMNHVYTPLEMVDWLEEKISDTNDPGGAAAKRGVLTDFRFIYGELSVFEEFVWLVKGVRDGINSTRNQVLVAWRQEINKIYIGETGQRLNLFNDQSPYTQLPSGRLHLKYQYYRWLEQVPRYMCEYYKLEVIGARKQVEALYEAQHISFQVKKYILGALEDIARLRVKVQLDAEYNEHGVLKHPPGAQPLPVTKRSMITQNEETGEWEKKTTGGDFLHVLNASEKDQLNQIHKVVDLLIRKSEKFFEWCRPTT